MPFEVLTLESGKQIFNPEEYFYVGQKVMAIGSLLELLKREHGVTEAVGYITNDNTDKQPWEIMYNMDYLRVWNVNVRWEIGSPQGLVRSGGINSLVKINAPIIKVKKVIFCSGKIIDCIDNSKQEEIDRQVFYNGDTIERTVENETDSVANAWASIQAKEKSEPVSNTYVDESDTF